jgi:DNA-directed RNA polymerase alpha subunit
MAAISPLDQLDNQIKRLELILISLKSLRLSLNGPSSITKIDVPLKNIELSTRVRNCLNGWSWSQCFDSKPPPIMLSEVSTLTKQELFRLPNFGRKSYKELWKICVDYEHWDRDDLTRHLT